MKWLYSFAFIVLMQRSQDTTAFAPQRHLLSSRQPLPVNILRRKTSYCLKTRRNQQSMALYQTGNPEDLPSAATAEELLQRARELRAEAQRMELALESTRSSLRKAQSADKDNMVDHLFKSNRPLTPEAIARVFREERWSVEQVELVLESLYKRHRKVSDLSSSDRQPENFQIADTNNAATAGNQTELEVVETYIHCILDAAAILDQEVADNLYSDRRWPGRGESTLRARMNEWRRADEENFKRRLAVDVYAAMKNSTASVESYMRQSLGIAGERSMKQFNASRVMEQVMMLPLWVPSSLVKFIVASRAKLAAEDVKAIKEKVLPASRFFGTSTDSIPTAAIFRGNIRPRSPMETTESERGTDEALESSAFAEIQRLMDQAQLSSRVQLFLMPDPEWRPNRDENEQRPKPVILALPRSVIPDENRVKQDVFEKVARRVSPVLALVTSFAFSVSCYALNGSFFDAIVNRQDVSVLISCLPVFLGVLAVQGVHELSHSFVAKARGIKIGKPTLIPSTQIGTFGCITPLRSFPKDRASLLDLALSGPVAGLVFSIFLMATGIHQTVNASQEALLRFPVVPIALLKSSFLSGSMFTVLAPKIMMLPMSQPIPIHPFFMVGFSGLFASALNLLPVFRLDGGRACSAAMGPRFAAIASAWTLLFLLSAALSGSSTLAWIWGAFILFFQRRAEIPVRDDVTEVSDVRLGTWIASLVTSLLALFPFPGAPGLL